MNKRTTLKNSLRKTGVPPPSAHARPNVAVRVVAGSLVLYAVIGTLAALNTSKASAASLAQGDARQTARVRGVKAKPFRDLLEKGRQMHARGEIDLREPFELSIEAERADDGTLSSVSINKLAGAGGHLGELAREFTVALSESRALESLEGVGHLLLTFRLDEQTASARIVGDTDSGEHAAHMAHGYNGLLTLGRIVKRDRAESVVLNNMTVSASGKQLVFRLEMSRAALGNLLLKQITPN